MASVETRKTTTGTTHFVRYTDPTTRKATSRTFTVKREAESFAGAVTRYGAGIALAQELAPRNALTLDGWAAQHFDTMTGLQPATVRKYRSVYASQWSPQLGALPLTAVDRAAIARVLNRMGGADKTIKNAHGILSTMLKEAVRARLIDRNEAEGMRLPNGNPPPEMRFLTYEEFDTLMGVVPDWWKPLVLTLATSGMRWGEAEAMLVSDINLDAMTMRIVKAIKHGSDRTRAGSTKTSAGRRVIGLPAQTIEALLPLIKGRRGDERLFTAPGGGAIHNGTFWNSVWSVSLVHAGIFPRPRIHDLRHTHVAWLIDAEVNVVVIQKRLGHESITTTIDDYGHLYPSGDRDAVLALENRLRRLEVTPVLAVSA